ncbi:hypothetical protein K461DRAFT_278553 [Myriangium duriaei CBS 260.36]|uniref:Uncharacterized protein n=1 Tax=Myriangium duriaei CBS 260.36 TaxID=1168546 RepID=A0A9P4J0V5_9PEZI|nr:hypothetical protein K461DRAFT_278553 [Myriangium duriaei CBS 260.36]
MPSIKDILRSPSKRRQEKAQRELKRTISGPAHLHVSREEAIGLVGPRVAPATPSPDTAIFPPSPDPTTPRPGNLQRMVTAPAAPWSPSRWRGKGKERSTGEISISE